MLNILWGAMLLLGITYGAMNGRMGAITDAALSSSKEAVALCIAMAGIMAFWVGMMEIAKRAGIIDAMTRKMRPILRFLFPEIPEKHPAMEYIAGNMIANFLGLGWAATPLGLKAMEELGNLNQEECQTLGETKKRAPSIASKSMCTFLIINISSLQLIPITIIAYRSQYGSVNPSAIVGAAIVATCVSTGVGVVFCKIMGRK